MPPSDIRDLFALDGTVAVVTGGGGVLYTAISKALARLGVRVAILDVRQEAAKTVADDVANAGGSAIAVACDVLDKASIEAARDAVLAAYGHVDVLINGAGGNHPQATATDEMPFFDIPADALEWVFKLNCLGTILPCQVFGKHMAERNEGIILNTSSMCAFSPLTKVVAYSAAKAAVSNFTQWLAVHMSQNYGPNIRVNAIAPGFFHTIQNHKLLYDTANDYAADLDPATGRCTAPLSARGQQILDHTPMGRYGVPDDLVGTIVWLLSPAASFVHGIVVPIDGGFSAFSGV